MVVFLWKKKKKRVLSFLSYVFYSFNFPFLEYILFYVSSLLKVDSSKNCLLQF